jgi:hypothetical protein
MSFRRPFLSPVRVRSSNGNWRRFGLDPRPAYAKLVLVMSAPHRRNYEYPEKTRGSEAARRIRAKANKLTAAERAELHRRAMQLIYGGTGDKEAVRSGQ